MVRLKEWMPYCLLLAQYDADFVGLLWGRKGCPAMKTNVERCAPNWSSGLRENLGSLPNGFSSIHSDPVNCAAGTDHERSGIHENVRRHRTRLPEHHRTVERFNGPPDHLRPILNQVMLIIMETPWILFRHR